MEKAQALPEEALPQPMLNLMDMPGYRKAFKAIKSLITDVSETHKISAELLASRRQNQPTAELALETETAEQFAGADFRLAW